MLKHIVNYVSKSIIFFLQDEKTGQEQYAGPSSQEEIITPCDTCVRNIIIIIDRIIIYQNDILLLLLFFYEPAVGYPVLTVSPDEPYLPGIVGDFVMVTFPEKEPIGIQKIRNINTKVNLKTENLIL